MLSAWGQKLQLSADDCRFEADQDGRPSGAPSVPGSALILGPARRLVSQLPAAVAPPSEHNGSTAFSGLKRPVVNEQKQQKPPLVLHLPAF